jgi:hypothetical protein
VTGGVSGATAVIDRIVGTTTAGYLVLRMLVGTFKNAETITDDGTTPGTATTSAEQAGYKNDSNEVEYYWIDDQMGVRCRFYSMAARVTVLTPGQYPGMTPHVIMVPTVTISPLDYRIVSSVPGYTPASGYYQILSIKAPTNRTTIDHYELELKEVP